MGTLSHIKNIYQQAFDDCKPEFVVFILKAYSIFAVLMFSLAVYGFFYRAFTGFRF